MEFTKNNYTKELRNSVMQKKNVKKSKKKIIIIVLLSVVAFVVLAISLAGIYVLNKLSQVETVTIDPDELMINIEVQESIDFGEGYLNVVLFGVDSREGELESGTLSDTIIIASLNNETKEVKLVSVYRDTYLNLSEGTYTKCNAAYSYGGATLAINMLNTNLDLDIEKFVTVDFTVITEIVDILGGIELEIEESEIDDINAYIAETASVAGKDATYFTEAGLQLVDGVQATTYARIRSTTGGDYKRTDRQRYVIEQIIAKVKECDLDTLLDLIDEVLPQVLTNFTATEIAYYAAAYMDIELGSTMGWPEIITTGTIPGVGSSVIPVTLQSNVIDLHEFLFPDLEYSPSSTVISNSSTITSKTSNYTSGTANTNTAYETNSEYSVTNELLGNTSEDDMNITVEEDGTINYGVYNNPTLEFSE